MSEKSKVLVVEDNDFVRMQIVKFLKDDGYDTVEATNGEVALEQIDAQTSLAIVDIRMEPIDGFEFIRALRGMENQTPVVLVTGDQNPDLLSEASRWSVSAVLMKPVDKERLLKVVERSMRQERHLDEG